MKGRIVEWGLFVAYCGLRSFVVMSCVWFWRGGEEEGGYKSRIKGRVLRSDMVSRRFMFFTGFVDGWVFGIYSAQDIGKWRMRRRWCRVSGYVLLQA